MRGHKDKTDENIFMSPKFAIWFLNERPPAWAATGNNAVTSMTWRALFFLNQFYGKIKKLWRLPSDTGRCKTIVACAIILW